MLSVLGEIIQLFRAKLKLMHNNVCEREKRERVGASGSELVMRLLTGGIFGGGEVGRVKQKVVTLTLLLDMADPSPPLQLLAISGAVLGESDPSA